MSSPRVANLVSGRRERRPWRRNRYDVRVINFVQSPTTQKEVGALYEQVRGRFASSQSGETAAFPPLLVHSTTDRPDALKKRIETATKDSADSATLLQGGSFVVQTSGSTGTVSNLVVLSSRALRASALATHQSLGGSGRWVLALPTEHIAGLQVVVRSAVAGQAPTSALSSSGFSLDRFLWATETAAATGAGSLYTALVSAQLSAALKGGPRAQQLLRKFDAILVGGGFVSADLLEASEAAGVRIVTTYGMTETSGGCVYDGFAQPGTLMSLSADNEVLLAGPTLMDGYLDTPAPWVTQRGTRFFATGDLADISDAGKLHVRGRVDDMIKTGGKKVFSHQVATSLESVPAVAEAFVFGRDSADWGQEVTAGVVLSTSQPGEQVVETQASPELVEQLRSTVGSQLGDHARPRTIAFLSALPRTALGKVPKQEVVAAVEDAISQGRAWQR